MIMILQYQLSSTIFAFSMCRIERAESYSPKHLQAPSDIGGSGGAPRRATARETEARSVPSFVAGIVNTEGPRP
jgi:hypothetical protein